MNNIRSTLATVWRIAAPYFRSEDKWAGRGLLAAVIAIELSLVAIDVLVNQWHNRFYNALQEKDWDRFICEIGIFCVLATSAVVLSVYQLYLNQWLQIRWRNWMTAPYLGEWLHDANHYRMQLQGDAADNPDQRIAEDVKLFVERTLDIGVGLLSSVVTLASFVVILWGLSAEAPLHLFGNEFAIPGYLVWGALIYAVFGTVLTQWIGAPLVDLDFQQQRCEADFRFNLVRVRENSEQIALLQGEPAERERLSARFGRVVANWYGIMSRTKRLTAFTAELRAGRRDLSLRPGGAGLFRRQDPARRHDADRRRIRQRAGVAVVLRLGLSHDRRMARGGRPSRRLRDVDRKRRGTWRPAAASIDVAAGRQRAIELRQAAGATAATATPLVVGRRLQPCASDERTLVTGPSGAGKSTLFRAIAGIWPFGSGTIAIPANATLMMLPQRPYFPIGSLHAAVVYPGRGRRLRRGAGQGGAGRGRPAAAGAAARRGGALEPDALARRAAAARRWRARCCMRRNILFLDEATASLDEPSEAALYRLLAESCRRPPSSRSATARRWKPSTSASVVLVREGDQFTLQDRERSRGRTSASVRASAAARAGGAPSGARHRQKRSAAARRPAPARTGTTTAGHWRPPAAD